MKQIIVLSGGFMSGYATLGALHHLFTQIPLTQFHIRAGTSIGAIILFLLTINYTIEEIINIEMIKIDILSNINNLFFSNSLISSHQPKQIFQTLLKNKNFPPNITLLQLYEITNIQLIFTTTCLNTNSPTYLSHLTFPNLPVYKACLMTSSFPIIFSPIKYKNKYYIDGGCTNNFPINLFKKYLPQTIGINLIDQISINFTPTLSLPEYTFYLLQLFYHNTKKRICEQYKNSTLLITVKNNFLKFDSNEEKKKQLFEMGYSQSLSSLNTLLM